VIQKEQNLNSLFSVVDDDQSVREATMGVLTSMGYCAETFSSAKEFLGSPLLNKTKCLILDLRMPGMNGLELQQLLTGQGSRIPIIFISAQKNDAFRREAMKAGAVQFLQKPVSEDVLLHAIRSALKTPPEDERKMS
jgi:FixJ family two-component response regulator